MHRKCTWLAGFLGLALYSQMALADASLVNLSGQLPGGQNFNRAYAVSDDGRVVVGHGFYPSETFNQAMRWTA